MFFAFRPASNPLKGYPDFVKEHFVALNGPDWEATLFMSKMEVSNKMWTDFLSDVAVNHPEKLEKYQVREENWSMTQAESQPLAVHYSTHQGFLEHPVLNISHDAAVAYCNWLTETLNPMVEQEIRFRLPTENEWIRSAQGLRNLSPYAWGGPLLHNLKGQNLCNFYQIGDEAISRDLESGEMRVVKDVTDIQWQGFTADCLSYPENDYGLYNMNGNVAEMIDQPGVAMGGSWASSGYDVRNESRSSYDAPNPFTGFRPLMEVL